MEEHKLTISYINGNPGFVVKADTAEEIDQLLVAALPIFKKFKTVVDVNHERQANAAANPPGTAPECPIHHTPMQWKAGISKKTGKPYGFFGCSTRNPDGSYCPGKV